MQSEPHDVFSNATTISDPKTPVPSSQHGLLLDDHAALSDSSHEGATGTGALLLTSEDAHDASSVHRADQKEPKSWMSTSGYQGDRIAQYENAGSPYPRKDSEGPAFEVVQTRRKSGNQTCAVDKLPNGMHGEESVEVIKRTITLMCL